MKDVVQKSRKRTYTNTKRLRRLNERKLTPKVNEFMRYMRKQLQRGLTRVRARKPETFTEQLADWDAIIEEGQRILKPELLKILAEGGKAVVERKIIKQEAEPRFDILGIPAVKWAEKHTAKLVTEIEETKQAIRQEVKAGIDYGKSIQKIAKELRPIVGLTSRQAGAVAKYRILLEEQALPQQKIASLVERYANRLHKFRTQMIARTETASALSEGTLQGFEQIGIKRVRGVADEEACEYCLENIDGKVYTLDEASGLIPAHPQCLPGNSLVSPGGRVTGVSKRWYKGKMVIIQTASGRKLRATPNHPILTHMGFRPAHSLNVGSSVICQGFSQRESFADWKNQYRPAMIEEIADSLFKTEGVTTMKVPSSPKDFHGDGIGSEVAVIGANRFLKNRFNTPFLKHLLELQLILRTMLQKIPFSCLSSLFQSLKRFLAPPSRFMSFSDLVFPLLRGHLLPAQSPCFAFCTTAHPSSKQSVFNNISANMISLSNLVFRLTGKVGLNNIIRGKLIPQELSFLVSGPFFCDKIVHVGISDYEGYVYNLETTLSYYIGNGIASHNCECAWVAES